MYCKIALVITLFHRHTQILERDNYVFGVLRNFHVKDTAIQTLCMLAIASAKMYFPVFTEK